MKLKLCRYVAASLCLISSLAGCEAVYRVPVGGAGRPDSLPAGMGKCDRSARTGLPIGYFFRLRGARLQYLILDGAPAMKTSQTWWLVAASSRVAHISRRGARAAMLLVRFPNGKVASAPVPAAVVGRFLLDNRHYISMMYRRSQRVAPGVNGPINPTNVSYHPAWNQLSTVGTLWRCAALRSNALFDRWVCQCGLLSKLHDKKP